MVKKVTTASGATRYACPKCGLSYAWEGQANACCVSRTASVDRGETVHGLVVTPEKLTPVTSGTAKATKIAAGGDPVNSPAHYTDGGIETIDFIEAKLNPEQFTGYCLGNAMKYLSRSGKKDTGDTDLRKARWYINRALGEENPRD